MLFFVLLSLFCCCYYYYIGACLHFAGDVSINTVTVIMLLFVMLCFSWYAGVCSVLTVFFCYHGVFVLL